MISIPLDEVNSGLDSGEIIVLRRNDHSITLSEGGDIDILVRDVEIAKANLLRSCGPPIAVMKRSHLEGWLWRWGLVDVIPEIQWHGAKYVNKNAVFESQSVAFWGLRYTDERYEALLVWLSKILWGGKLKDDYLARIIDVCTRNEDFMLEELSRVFGRIWAKRLVGMARAGNPEKALRHAGKLRRTVWARSFVRSPQETLAGWLRHWMNAVEVRLHPPMPWIGFLGMDGSGKTSVLSTLRSRLESNYWIRGTRLVHWRPGSIKGSRDASAVTDPHSRPVRGVPASVAKILMIVADWWFGYLKDLVHYRAEWRMLFSDRHYHDLWVDPKRYRYGGPLWLVRLFGYVTPKPDLFIFLDVPAEVAYARKPEVPLEEGRRLRERYLALARRLPKAHVVDANRPLEQVVGEVEEIILRHMEQQTKKKLGLT